VDVLEVGYVQVYQLVQVFGATKPFTGPQQVISQVGGTAHQLASGFDGTIFHHLKQSGPGIL